MATTQVQQGNISLSWNTIQGGIQAKTSVIKDMTGTVVDFSSGWTFGMTFTPQNPNPLATPYSMNSSLTFTGNADGTVTVTANSYSQGSLPSLSGSIVLLGSTDSFSTVAVLAKGGLSASYP